MQLLKLLKSRSAAVIITVIACAAAVSFGFHRSAGAAASKVETLWLTGASDLSYKSAQELYADRATAAERFAYIASDLENVDSSLVDETLKLAANALNAKTLPTVRDYEELETAVTKLRASLGSDINDEAAKELSIFTGSGSAFMKEAALYNAEADALIKKTNGFPFALLQIVVPIESPYRYK